MKLAYRIGNSQAAVFRRPLPTDAAPLPVLASPDVAGSADPSGGITLSFDGGTLPARIVGVAQRFPAGDGDGFVVADEPALAAALNAQDPGTGTPGELWLRARDPGRAAELDAALARPPFDVLVRSSRRELHDSLAADPLAHGVLVASAAPPWPWRWPWLALSRVGVRATCATSGPSSTTWRRSA